MLEGRSSVLGTFPAALEQSFRDHSRQRAAKLLRRSIYLLFGIYLLVVLPISLFSVDAALHTWQALAMIPIGLVLAGIWVTTRLPWMDEHVETTLGISLFVCLCGTIYCSMLLGDRYFGLMASYETIYILVIAFSILRLPTLLALRQSIVAFLGALAVSIWKGVEPLWLNMLLYFGVPLIICIINGFMLEYTERRNFLQHHMLNLESTRLAQLQQKAQREAEREQKNAQYLELIAGNLSTQELFNRTLRFLAQETDALVGHGYLIRNGNRLHLLSQWSGDPAMLVQKSDIRVEDTLIGPALRERRIMQIGDIPPGYLPIKVSIGEFKPEAIIIVPVYDGERPVAALELGRFSNFDSLSCELLEAVATHFAYAVVAAEARAQLAAVYREPMALAV